jgi:exodeoxyribonuclease-3
MKVFSWNVNGIRAVYNKGAWSKFIDQTQPDIICLQEIKAKKDQVNFLTDYQVFLNPAEKAGYSGTAILTKQPPIKVYYNLPDELISKNHFQTDLYGNPNQEGRVITAEFKNFYLVSVYTPNAKNDLSRLELRHKEWDPLFLDYLKQLDKKKPIVVGGDFNVAHQEIDLANPKTNRGKKGFTDQERQGLDNFIKSGFIDTFRSLHPNEINQYTWWSHFAQARQRNIGWRIDYFLSSQRLSKKIVTAQIHPNILGSDHCPISIELKD